MFDGRPLRLLQERAWTPELTALLVNYSIVLQASYDLAKSALEQVGRLISR